MDRSTESDISFFPEAVSYGESERAFSSLSPEGRLLVEQGKILFINDRGRSILGIDPKLGDGQLPAMEDLLPDMRELFKLRDEEILHTRTVIRTLSGTQRPVRLSVKKLGGRHYLILTENSEERSEGEEDESARARKYRLETSGMVAAGVAHEVNNPLTGMINFAQLIFDNSDQERIRRYARSVIKEGSRIARILRNLLSYSAYRDEGISLMQPSEIVRDALALVKGTFRAEFIIVAIHNAENLPSTYLNGHEIEQVLINLLLNARDSLNRRYKDYHPDKRIDISLSLQSGETGQELVIEVRDQGTGIDPADSVRIFEDGFTTGDRSFSSGLGLGVCRRIIEKQNGSLKVRSKQGEGAAFIVHLPLNVSQRS